MLEADGKVSSEGNGRDRNQCGDAETESNRIMFWAFMRIQRACEFEMLPCRNGNHHRAQENKSDADECGE
jgi:hypothetical protein